VDRAEPRGSAARGTLYAFTLGMAPWAKESTRRHALSYVRGIGFHLAIFLDLGLLILSPWWPAWSGLLRGILALASGLGAMLGVAGIVLRRTEANLRALSTFDDLLAVTLVTLFQASCALALAWPGLLPLAYVVATVMFVDVPLGKIRHCIYFFFSRRFFGTFIGRRGVMHLPGSAPIAPPQAPR
jgi:nitrate reductase gamma subunit